MTIAQLLQLKAGLLILAQSEELDINGLDNMNLMDQILFLMSIFAARFMQISQPEGQFDNAEDDEISR